MEFILRWTPEIPSRPQLPRRSFLENMYVQYGEGLPGAIVDPEQRRFQVTDEPPIDEVVDFLEPLEKDDPSLFAISSGRAAGIPAFAAEGGLLAWSSVPDDERALTLRAAQVVRRLLTGAAALEKTGAISAEEVLGRSFVSPACGTEALPVEVAERCFELSFETSVWLRERLSRGGRTRQSARLVPPEAKGGAADIQ